MPSSPSRETEISELQILDFMPDDLKHLTKLQTLSIKDCPILAQRFKRTGEISYEIEIVESFQSDVRVHIRISCDNCQMFPIVGKRYKCKDCYNVGAGGFDLCEDCYTDLVNQHHTQGHTFELIANRGDNPVPVHPDDPSEDAKGDLVVTKSAEIEEQNKA
ncbi:hypothetical protein AQUCO_05500082v1 [Aquilegia coerulea]|uniref:ZZ-type domain-containing protein n=1 Tax=Aquilegia coerulea TaxID=218851 RepID=A0A2G5CGX9_AQUCA|nr:hypothetical protein AQUCO_05500082v1 [Aquilegia coerulea]